MRKRVLFGTMMLASLLFLSACKGQNPAPETKTTEHAIEETSVKEEAVKSLSDSSVNLFYSVVKKEADEKANILISPISLMTDIGMLENGASGETLDELEQGINGGLSIDEFNESMYSIGTKLKNEKEVSWNVANALYINDGTLADDYARAVEQYYQAEVDGTAFDSGTAKKINQWVKKNTKGMIPKLYEDNADLSELKMCLLNAIAFEGKWQEEYEEGNITENQDFTNADGTKSKVNYLNHTQGSYFNYGDGLGFTRAYQGGNYSFVGLLPPKGMSVLTYVEKIAKNQEHFSDVVRNQKDATVYVRFPEFSGDYSVPKLKEMFKDMGMNRAFGESPDYKKILATGRNLQVEDVIHKTHIEVDRKGTKAAAVTNIEAKETAMPIEEEKIVEINLERPFVYAIIENETGLPVFIGCINQMK